MEERRRESRRSSLCSPQMGRSGIGLSSASSGALEKRTSAGVGAQQLLRAALITEICSDCSSSCLAQASGSSLTDSLASLAGLLYRYKSKVACFLHSDINAVSSLLQSHESPDRSFGAAIFFGFAIHSQLLCISTLAVKLWDLFHPYGSVSAQFSHLCHCLH